MNTTILDENFVKKRLKNAGETIVSRSDSDGS